MLKRLSPGRLGLRARATLAFTVGAAALSAVLAATTYGLVHHYLLAQRKTSAMRQVFASARLVRQDLNAKGADVADVLSSLSPGTAAQSLLLRDGRWYSTSVSAGRGILPASLTRVVTGGRPAFQLTTVAGAPAIAIGVPLPAVSSYYFEVRSLAELQTTLDTVGIVLALVALCIASGGAALGWWAGARLVRPLREVANVAEAISRGDLERRLAGPQDADLAPLVAGFNRMVGALQDRIEREQRFTSDVSHELRSPLTAMETSAEVLSMFRSCLPAEGNKALDLLLLETDRFSGTVEALLEISRIDAGAAQLATEDIELDELVAYAVSAQEVGDVPVVICPGAHDLVVRADKRRILRAVANLLENAVNHGGGVAAVRVSRQGPWAAVTVEDEGPGVPADQRERIFERFYRGSGQASIRRGGSGLGLALVAEHVQLHGGTVEVGDRPGGGAAFTIRLPVST